MCGICGIWNHPDETAISNMVHAMRHRGPDDSGIYTDSKIALGATRLKIIDVTQTGHQPMTNHKRMVWIAFNGEIYNFQEKRKFLEKKGYPFFSTSDTEVILNLYYEFGDAFLSHLRGMFAIAVYDKRGGPGKERLLLARDPFGIKPLLYYQADNYLVFGSEIKTLLSSNLIRKKLDPEALRLLLTYGSVYQPGTILEGVKSLPPAHKMVFEDGRMGLEKYWSLQLDRIPALRSMSYAGQVDFACNVLEEAAKLHAISDVPLGAFLSGGVDSSLLAGLLSRSQSHALKTFSIGYEQEGKKLDESYDAQKTADFLGTDHQREIITGEDIKGSLMHFIRSLDQPSVDGLNSYFISKIARQNVTVAISGTGGDELFTGYPWFISMALFADKLKEQKLRASIREMLGSFARNRFFNRLALSHWGQSIFDLRNSSDLLAYYGTLHRIFDVKGTAAILSSEVKKSSQVGAAKSIDLLRYDELPNSHAVERTTGLCLRNYLMNQLLRDMDATSSAVSLEVRVPYIDLSVVNMSLSLPVSSKLQHYSSFQAPKDTSYRISGSKKILVDVGLKLGILRPDIVDQSKRGFEMPIAFWLKNHLKDVLDDALSPASIQSRGIFQSVGVEKIKQDFDADRISWVFPWLLMVTELWCRDFLDG